MRVVRSSFVCIAGRWGGAVKHLVSKAPFYEGNVPWHSIGLSKCATTLRYLQRGYEQSTSSNEERKNGWCSAGANCPITNVCSQGVTSKSVLMTHIVMAFEANARAMVKIPG